MPKTPDEIKKGLECCWGIRAETGLVDCEQCPYWGVYGCPAGKVKLGNDALALIQQLQEENAEKDARIQQLEKDKDDLLEERELNDFLRGRVKQLEAERDAAVADIKQMVLDPYEPCFCDYCKLTEEECARSNCKGRSAFVWRGVQKD